MPKPVGTITTVVSPQATIQPGVYDSPVISIPDGKTSIELYFSRINWPLSADGTYIVKAQFFISYDNGVTWHLLIGFTADGGNVVDKNGIAQNISSVSRKMKPGVGRKMKVHTEVKAAFTTQISVDFW